LYYRTILWPRCFLIQYLHYRSVLWACCFQIRICIIGLFLKESHFMHKSFGETIVLNRSTGLPTVSKSTKYTGWYVSGCAIVIWVLFHAAVSGRMTLSGELERILKDTAIT
jgi:hypothetical protein